MFDDPDLLKYCRHCFNHQPNTTLTTTTQNLRFWLPGACVPKARARVTRNGTYLPLRYRNWRQFAETEIVSSLSLNVQFLLPIRRAEVRITLQGNKHRGDTDNLGAACLDTLVAAGVLADDRLPCVPHLVVSHQPEGDSGVWVEVTLL